MGRVRRHKKPLDDVKEMSGCWKLKTGALDGTSWSICIGRGYGHVVRQTVER